MKFKTLKIRCSSTDCQSALHYFKPTTKMMAVGQRGICRDCGADLVDWTRVYKRDFKDVDYVIKSLKSEYFRYYMWHVDIDQKAINHAHRKGISGMRLAVENRIRKSIASANPSFDGRQTPREGSGNAICYAQHATATCCRKCLEYWHGIPQNVELSDEDVLYFTNLVMLYIRERLPHLSENGERVAPIRARSSSLQEKRLVLI